MNGPGGPWAFWIEVKGPKTPVNEDQQRIGASLKAAGIPWFVVRHPNDLHKVMETVGFPITEADFRGEYSRENDVQTAIKQVLKVWGFDIIDTSQGYRPGGKRHGTTRITKGTPDLFVWRKPRG